MPEIGKLYRVTSGGKTLPNLYRYEGDRPLHCQLHGERYGTGWVMRKRRNSDVKPWGSVSVFDIDGTRLEPVE